MKCLASPKKYNVSIADRQKGILDGYGIPAFAVYLDNQHQSKKAEITDLRL